MDVLELVVGTAQADLPQVRGEPNAADALEKADWGVSGVWGEARRCLTNRLTALTARFSAARVPWPLNHPRQVLEQLSGTPSQCTLDPIRSW